VGGDTGAADPLPGGPDSRVSVGGAVTYQYRELRSVGGVLLFFLFLIFRGRLHG